MADLMIRQSALAHLGLEGRARKSAGKSAGESSGETAGIALAEQPPRAILDLRADPGDAEAMAAIEKVLGFALPQTPNTAAAAKGAAKAPAKAPAKKDKPTALWLGPDQWWIVGTGPKLDPTAKLAQALEGRHAALTEIGESRACIALSGPRARDLLAKASPLDFHPSRFQPGTCAQSHLAKAAGLIHQTADAPAYDLYVLRSFAEYLWNWLEDAGREYGVIVVAPGVEEKAAVKAHPR